MANTISYQQANEQINKGIDELIAQKGYAYACGYLGSIVSGISLMMPESREQILGDFKRFIDIETNAVENK